MRCLRCGYCCMHSFVVVVRDPDMADREGISDDNLMVVGANGPERCPHLVGDRVGEYSCAVHGRPWYRYSPCAAHVQVEVEDSDCRMGAHLLKGGV